MRQHTFSLALVTVSVLTLSSPLAYSQSSHSAVPAAASSTPSQFSQQQPPSLPPTPQSKDRLPKVSAGASKVEVPASPGQSVAKQLNEAFINVFEHVAPAVVVLDVSKDGGYDTENNPMDYFGDFFFKNQPNKTPNEEQLPPRPHRSQSEGSGFIIQSDGYIITNYHVVSGSSKVNVRLKDRRTFPGKLIGTDEKTDIAVIKIEAKELPTVEFADSEQVRVGQLCFAIGVPFKQDYTFTQGIVSAKNRNNLQMAAYEDYIQTDASINPGNSGGPLLDLEGHVIGMNTLINGLNRGLGFAIPSNMLRDIGGQLIKSGRIIRPYLGVRIETLTDDAARRDAMMFAGVKKGVVVRTIEPDTPAYKSDLKPADVITEIDGVPVTNDRELQRQVLAKKVGQSLSLTVVRKGKTLKIPVVTGELPTEEVRTGRSIQEGGGLDKGNANATYGLQVQKLTKELAETLGMHTEAGVIVTNVAEGSPADHAGLKVRDVITTAGNRSVNDPESFKEALKNSDPKRGVDLYVMRGGSKTFVVLKAEK